jgi:hypothetical protein
VKFCKEDSVWPRGPLRWYDTDGNLSISVPFTWELPALKKELKQGILGAVRIGGPAVDLMPDYFADMPEVRVEASCPGVLQRINPLATRTTLGCTRRCCFCGVGRGFIEPGGIRELNDWPDLPVICDNNLLAASFEHFERVMNRLERHAWSDFNQGLDTRLLTHEHALRLGRLREAQVRLAFDSMADVEYWFDAVSRLRKAGVAKHRIPTYVLCGYRDSPADAWQRCTLVSNEVKFACPQWFHSLTATRHNVVTKQQRLLGWTERERKNIMQWHYQHNAKYGGPPGWTKAKPALGGE